MTKQIKVDGQIRKVLNTLSSGPGETPTTYVIHGGYVVNVGFWQLEQRGQFPRRVTVEAA